METKDVKYSTLEAKFIKTWNKRHPDIPLKFGGVGSLQIVGVKGTRSQIDFYHEQSKTAIELHGATFKGCSGAHSSGTGIRRDATKALVAQLAGWKLLTLDNLMATDANCLDAIADNIKGHPPQTAWAYWKHLFPQTKTKKKTGTHRSSVDNDQDFD